MLLTSNLLDLKAFYFYSNMFSKQVEGQTLNYVKNNELSLSLNKTSILYFQISLMHILLLRYIGLINI